MAERTVADLDAPRGWRVRHRVHRSIVREAAGGYDQPMLLHAPADPRPEAPPAQEADEVADRLERVARELQSLAAAPVVTTETDAIDRCFARLKLVDGALAAVRARLTTAAVRSDAPAERGERDSTTYLRNRLGISGREARRRAELARGLEELPQTAAALAEGRIGEERAAAIARASRSGRLGSADQLDEELLAVAERETPESLDREIRRREHQADEDALRRDENRAFARRRCTSRRRKDGMWDIDATLDALNGELVDRMIRAFAQPDPADTPPEQRRSPEQRLADGLIAAAHSALSGGDAPQDGGVRPHLAVYAPIEAFAGIPGAAATSESGVVISSEALTRLGCDACLAFVLTRGPSQLLHSGRATRNWPGPTRRAIIVRDVHCRFPGCSVPAARSVIHHVRYYSNGGETSIDNGVLICIFHHRLVHEGRWRLGLDPASAEVTATSPTGRVLRGLPPLGVPPDVGAGAAEGTHRASADRGRILVAADGAPIHHTPSTDIRPHYGHEVVVVAPPAGPQRSTPAGPLDGILVADFSRILAGPYATMLLADLGADVVKVEGPTGDDTRTWLPPVRDGISTYYLGINRNKRSIVLDLKDEDDLALAHELAARADVLIENMRPGGMLRFGLDHDTVRAGNPGIVYASISGFGTTEQAASLAGYDLMVQGISGLMSLTGDPDGPAYRAGMPVCDVLAGLHATVGILAALHRRHETGRGQRIEVDLLSSTLSGLVNHTSAVVASDVTPFRMGNAHPSLFPYEPLPTADGEILVIAGNDRQFVELCEVLGIPEVARDDRFGSNEGRTARREELMPLLLEALAKQTTGEWFQRFRDNGLPGGPVNTVREGVAFAAAVGLHPVVEVGEGDAAVPSIRHPITLSDSPPTYRYPPPDLGEHTDELRAWLRAPRD